MGSWVEKPTLEMNQSGPHRRLLSPLSFPLLLLWQWPGVTYLRTSHMLDCSASDKGILCVVSGSQVAERAMWGSYSVACKASPLLLNHILRPKRLLWSHGGSEATSRYLCISDTQSSTWSQEEGLSSWSTDRAQKVIRAYLHASGIMCDMSMRGYMWYMSLWRCYILEEVCVWGEWSRWEIWTHGWRRDSLWEDMCRHVYVELRCIREHVEGCICTEEDSMSVLVVKRLSLICA